MTQTLWIVFAFVAGIAVGAGCFWAFLVLGLRAQG